MNGEAVGLIMCDYKIYPDGSCTSKNKNLESVSYIERMLMLRSHFICKRTFVLFAEVKFVSVL